MHCSNTTSLRSTRELINRGIFTGLGYFIEIFLVLFFLLKEMHFFMLEQQQDL